MYSNRQCDGNGKLWNLRESVRLKELGTTWILRQHTNTNMRPARLAPGLLILLACLLVSGRFAGRFSLWDPLFGHFRSVSFAQEVSPEICRLGAFVWDIWVQELSLGIVGLVFFIGSLSHGILRMEIIVWHPPRKIYRLGAFAWEL